MVAYAANKVVTRKFKPSSLLSFQELFLGDTTDTSKMPVWQKILTNKFFATVITLLFGYLLTLGGYTNVWPLFGSANQLLAALVLIALVKNIVSGNAILLMVLGVLVAFSCLKKLFTKKAKAEN